jgi:hypothetical protein
MRLILLFAIMVSGCQLFKKLEPKDPICCCCKPEYPEFPVEPPVEPPITIPPVQPLPPEPENDFCIDMNADPEQDGPYRWNKSKVGRVNLWVPKNLPQGCKAPIAHISNGTGAWCLYYASVAKRLASHGYVVSCYESTQTGSGDQCMQGLETASTASPNADKTHAVSTGHSQGGSGSAMCAYQWQNRYPDYKMVVVPLQPAWGMNTSNYKQKLRDMTYPSFVVSGDRDRVVRDSWIRQGWNVMNAPSWWYRAMPRCTHWNVQAWAKTAVPAFARWKLLGGGEAAKSYFLEAMPNSEYWEIVDTKP